MICPNCQTGIRLDIEGKSVYKAANTTDRGIEVGHGFCSECKQLIVILKHGKYVWRVDDGALTDEESPDILYPKVVNRAVDHRIPEKYRQEFNETNSVLSISPKASAALSRRLLQSIIWDEFRIKERNLEVEISTLIQTNKLPLDIAEALDAVRNIGNFAAHPIKYTNTGEIVDVEPGEAEWLIEVIEALLDFVFVQTARTQERKDRLNQKLDALGKPLLKI